MCEINNSKAGWTTVAMLDGLSMFLASPTSMMKPIDTCTAESEHSATVLTSGGPISGPIS